MRPSTIVVAVAALTLLAGCATGAPASAPDRTPGAAPTASPSGAAFNATDVMFAQMMIAHEARGRELVRLAQSGPVRPAVRTLAAAIEVTEAAETETMTGWLRAWGQPLTADPDAHAAHGGLHGTSDAQVAALRGAPDAEFERDFLNLMIAHQHTAVEYARMATAAGVNPDAAALARRVDQSRSAQVTQMLGLLR
ncbi:Uncharacterized conserved protein, DUF305 family [Micromonospora pattaloongensis]|uniref:Uncharacterized conserved protein, DUF305 family n=1 Tax=Micromonospora pattaloongensis TaxID=405436 RepID=A0A1H3RUU7_9ACTN|nr:DUF305 domain-containing protein [Micromonospora pattaloongensis]SDZ29486.1 Uncharacterized conserved protein, DUF305 family [Micromonospora pattaloongensis]